MRWRLTACFFLPAVGRVHPEFRTPGISIFALSAWSAVLVLSRPRLRPAIYLRNFRELDSLWDDHYPLCWCFGGNGLKCLVLTARSAILWFRLCSY